MKLLLFIFFVLALFAKEASAQTSDNRETNQFHIHKISDKITLDGITDEPVWQTIAPATDFWEQWPDDQKKALLNTEVRLAFNDQFLYISAVLKENPGYKHIIPTLKRDAPNFFEGDNFIVVLDPVNERSSGFIFGVNAGGAQMEGMLGAFEPDWSWDNKWFVETKNNTDNWTIEMAIPFKSLRFVAKQGRWGINLVRSDLKNNKYYSWARVPVQFQTIDIGYTGSLIWDDLPPAVNSNISIIPYISGALSKNFEDHNPSEIKPNAGLDAKVALTSSLNLDLTLNPDFSQVDVDEQQTNLTRFDILFPEKRTFFLENADLYSEFGIPPIRPFFSRTIGLNEDAEAVPILYGARISGNLNQNWRLGVFNIQTRAHEGNYGQNNTAFTLHRKLFQRSVVKILFTNRQSTDGNKFVNNDYGRNLGGEFNYVSADGKWTLWQTYHSSFKPGLSNKNQFTNTGFFYSGKKMNLLVDFDNVGENYHADMGFINRIENYDAIRDTTIRVGFKFMFVQLELFKYPSDKKVNLHQSGLENFIVVNPDFSFNEWSLTLRHELQYKNTGSLSFRLDNTLQELLYPFSFTDNEPLPAQRYNFTALGIEYESDQRKSFSVNTGVGGGTFYNGTRGYLSAGLLYRRQPWGNFALGFELNDLRFPEPYGRTQLLLISPKVEISFTRYLFWTTFLQYNTQEDNFNINSRFQWRYKPMSDLFVVYSDNYAVEFFGPKNRALVIKLNYWFTL